MLKFIHKEMRILMKFNWLKSKKNLFFILLFIIDLSAKFIIDRDNFTVLDFFVRVVNYLILASISPLIVKASKVPLNRDNNIFILMLSLVLSGFSISFIKSSYDVFLLTNKNGNIFLN